MTFCHRWQQYNPPKLPQIGSGQTESITGGKKICGSGVCSWTCILLAFSAYKCKSTWIPGDIIWGARGHWPSTLYPKEEDVLRVQLPVAQLRWNNRRGSSRGDINVKWEYKCEDGRNRGTCRRRWRCSRGKNAKKKCATDINKKHWFPQTALS